MPRIFQILSPWNALLVYNNIACKRTHSIKIETHAKHGNHYHKEKWSFHAAYEKFGKPSTE